MTLANNWTNDFKTETTRLGRFGLGLIVVFAGGFGVWGATAPLSGAAVAPGVVAVAGKNQMVQHLEGGIVREILFHEGDHVRAGQPVIELDPTQAQSRLNRVEKQLVGLRAHAVRLMAERDGAEALFFDRALVRQAEKENSSDLLLEQQKEFDARLRRHRQEQAILEQRIAGLDEEIRGLTAHHVSINNQLDVVREEAVRKKGLLDKGLTNRSEYTSLLRSEAELVGAQGQAISSVLSTKTNVAEAKEQLSRLATQRVEAAVSELNDIRTQIADLEEQVRAAGDVLERVVLRSPSDGIIVEMEVNSKGNVIPPGGTVLELLPTNEDLVIEARVSPLDVDVVAPGQEARLQFSALNTRITPSVKAVVTYLSADRLVDRATQEPYYMARLRIAEKLPPEISKLQIYPGMPVETYISTEARTFFQYMIKPVADSFNRAFNEE